jgi:hypothetical protein
LNTTFFNEFTLRVTGDAAGLVERLAAQGVLAGVPVSRLLPGAGLDDLLLVASTEVNTDEDRAALVDGATVDDAGAGGNGGQGVVDGCDAAVFDDDLAPA